MVGSDDARGNYPETYRSRPRRPELATFFRLADALERMTAAWAALV